MDDFMCWYINVLVVSSQNIFIVKSVQIIHLLKLSFWDGIFVFMAHFSCNSLKTHLTNMITQGYEINIARIANAVQVTTSVY